MTRREIPLMDRIKAGAQPAGQMPQHLLVKHDPSEKPEVPGVYVTQEPDGSRYFNRWDGQKWHWGQFSANMCGEMSLNALPAHLLAAWYSLHPRAAKAAGLTR